jgi:carboxyl-terminal processing protease
MASEAVTYLQETLDYIQRHALRSGNVDWQATRAEALARIQHTQTTADTYPTLRWVLSCLGDHHSFLASPQSVRESREGIATSSGLLAVYPEGVIVAVDPHSPAAQAGLQVRDTIETINGEPVAHLDRVAFQRAFHTSPLTLSFRQASAAGVSSVILHAASYIRERRPQGWPLGPDIGYLELPAVSGNDAVLKTYAQAARQCVRDMDQAGIHQWIIDVRRNTGGNMWTMLAGVYPLLGDGECGFFVSSDGKKQSWIATKATQTKKLLGEPYYLTYPVGATAILTSRLTCSSGESTTLAFRGRPQTRSFGEPTAGLPTANRGKTLRDGAQLFLTVAYGADRTGQIYEGPIMPDQLVTSDWTLFQTEQDPVLLSAIAWLKEISFGKEVS